MWTKRDAGGKVQKPDGKETQLVVDSCRAGRHKLFHLTAHPLRTMDDDGESTAEYLHKEQMYMDRLEKQVRMVKAQIPSRGPLKNGRKTVEELFEAVKARDENHEALDKAGLIWYGKESPDPNNDKRRVMYGTELPDNGRVYRNTLRPD